MRSRCSSNHAFSAQRSSEILQPHAAHAVFWSLQSLEPKLVSFEHDQIAASGWVLLAPPLFLSLPASLIPANSPSLGCFSGTPFLFVSSVG